MPAEDAVAWRLQRHLCIPACIHREHIYRNESAESGRVAKLEAMVRAAGELVVKVVAFPLAGVEVLLINGICSALPRAEAMLRCSVGGDGCCH